MAHSFLDFVHVVTLLTAICRLIVATYTLLQVACNVVSLTNVAVVTPASSAQQVEITPRTLPCGTQSEITCSLH